MFLDWHWWHRLFVSAVVLLLLVTMAAPLQADTLNLKLPNYKKVVLKNGLTVLLMEQHEVPIISLHYIVRAGATADPPAREGLASLTADLLRKGTTTRTAAQLSAELDFIGAQLGGSAGADYSSGSAEFLKRHLAAGLSLLADILINPTFPPDELTKRLSQRIDEVKSAKDQAEEVIGTYFNKFLFGTHPYARPSDGDETSLPGITRRDVVQYYQKHYAPGNTILAASGDFHAADMEALISAKFGPWPSRQAPAVDLPAPSPVQGRRLLLVDKPDATQTFFQIGNIGIARTNPDRVAIGVVNTVFGGRFTSMLNAELRISSGLTYGARSYFEQRKTRGAFVISSYTRNESTEKAIGMALQILKRLHQGGIAPQVLQSAKNYIKGQFPPDIETTDQLAFLMARLEFYGLDKREIDEYYAQIDAVSVEDVRRVIRQYFPLDDLVFVLIGKRKEIEGLARKVSLTVQTKSISDPGF